MLEKTAFKHHDKKILGQVLCIGDGMALAADKSKNRPPINFAQVGERFAGLLLVASRVCAGKNHAPTCCHEAVWALTRRRSRALTASWGRSIGMQGGAHVSIYANVRQAKKSSIKVICRVGRDE